MKTSTCGFSPKVLALAAALGLSLTGLHRVNAAPSPTVAEDGPTLTLLSPAPHASFNGVKPVEISAFYQSSPGNGIVSLELYIDGVKAQSKTLDAPESKGIVSFLVDASLLSSGPHRVVVRATAADAEVRSVKGTFEYGGDGAISPPPAPQPEDTTPTGPTPDMRLLTPAPGSKVQGTVVIRVAATDADGKTPYVSIFVDGEFKTLVNYRPFEYEWDTSAISNGWHTIAITEAFDGDGQPVARLKPTRVYVNNPGGETTIRHDLLDGAAPMPVQPSQIRPMPARATRKTTALRPQIRRPSGAALLATPTLTARAPKSAPVQMAKGLFPWDDLHLNMDQGLSDPFVPDLPAPHSATAKITAHAATPVFGFKPSAPRPASAPVMARRLPLGKHGQPLPTAAPPLQRMAKASLDNSGLSSPFLSLPALPAAAPRHLDVMAPHPAVQAHLMRLSLRMPHLQIHLPQLPGRTPMVKPHLGASLLSAVGQSEVLFNTTKLQLDRPVAAQQSVVFGPLRQIFEYGGGSLQWNARVGAVRAQAQNKDISLTIGQKTAIVNAKPIALDAAPYLSAGRTMIPLSFLPQALDVTVQYDPVTNHLRITSKH